ncbi:MAG TPA: TetR/AcrR family transcriptional regulator [Cyclobacteriaceae bacterium]|jgi:AcrR family transcriptional regulator|nr:TetR/AcrR family transcriptional regulator [Cyclobacteriaceae bacterium]
MRTKDESKEQAIREKAIEMIVKDGFEGLSMQKLAKEANVSPATIYLYFKNKEDMLNQLYMGIEQIFSDEILRDFNPEMSLEEGLWIQWKNRFAYSRRYPYNFTFMEQFRSSPLINHKDLKDSPFKDAMSKFYMNMLRRKEMKEYPVEIFWSIGYGPLYSLIRFHQAQKSMMNDKFVFDEKKMRQAFDLVMKALKS